MGFKRKNGAMLILALLLTGCSIGLGWALTSSRLHLSIILIIVVLILLIQLHRTLSKTNQEILFFFKALKNDDTSINYTANRRNSLLDELSHHLNEINLNFRKMKVDQELREQYFNLILENLSGGLMVVTKTGHVHHINPQALTLFDIPKLTHIKALKEVHPELFGVVKDMRPGSKGELSVLNRNESLKKVLGLQCTGINLRGEDVLIITVQDLSVEMEQKEIEDWIRLIRIMSHEIMNSLAPITSISNTLKELWDEDKLQDQGTNPKVSQTIKGLDAIAEQSEGLTTFFESYRVLSRIPDPVKKEFLVCSMLEKLETLVAHMQKNQKIRFSFTCSDPSLKLHADEQMTTQVLLNLIQNASQALKGISEPNIKIKAVTEGKKVLISVIDNGEGIPPEIAEEIFLPFFTTRQKGTGVGLSYSRQIMKLNGGNIDFESRKGRTSFRLSFPNIF
jgi:two-component system nitrogen regulation sensor histidine kinase NtrY